MLRFASRAILAIALAMVGCTANTIVKAPGGEEGAPLDGKADGFRSPTEHGTLRFGNESRGELKDGEKFHSWTFSLSGDAEVSLRTGSSDQNLDTVLYLYHRASASDSWGSYVEKNDDANDGTVFSAIEKSLGEGEYRIIVKGYKDQLQGPFTVSADCSGAGCESLSPEPEVSVPAATGFTESCVNRLWQSFDSNILSRDEFSIHPNASEGYDKEVLVANAHYAGLSDWAEYVSDDERADYTFDVELVRSEDGAVVTMADGGDESTTDYAFDREGHLLAYYVHNQSPWTEYYCGEEGDEAASEPDEDCLDNWIRNAPRDQDYDTDGTQTYTPGASNDGLDARMKAAVRVYIDSELDGEDAAINIELREWETGGSYLLSSERGAAISYAVVDSWDGVTVVFESSENADGPVMICETSR